MLEAVALRDGSDTSLHVDSRDVLSRSGAAFAFAVAHNHPGGQTEPSASNIALPTALQRKAHSVGLHFLDHVHVAGAKWRSIR